MIIADLHEGFEGAAVNACGYTVVVGFTDPRSRMPVHTIDLEFPANQVVGIADDDAIRCRVEIDDVTRTRRTAGQSLALTDRKHLDAVMFTDEISIDVVNFAALKFVFAQMGPQKRFVIVSGNKTNFLAVDLVGDLQT